jgi:hypothetical protein
MAHIAKLSALTDELVTLITSLSPKVSRLPVYIWQHSVNDINGTNMVSISLILPSSVFIENPL